MISKSCRGHERGLTRADEMGYDYITSGIRCRTYRVNRRGWYWRVRTWTGFFKGRGPYKTRGRAEIAADKWVRSYLASKEPIKGRATDNGKSRTAARSKDRR